MLCEVGEGGRGGGIIITPFTRCTAPFQRLVAAPPLCDACTMRRVAHPAPGSGGSRCKQFKAEVVCTVINPDDERTSRASCSISTAWSPPSAASNCLSGRSPRNSLITVAILRTELTREKEPMNAWVSVPCCSAPL
eukprot:COSAG01_NODE_21207_length_913_cov_0.886978_2_plen_136_part_00